MELKKDMNVDLTITIKKQKGNSVWLADHKVNQEINLALRVRGAAAAGELLRAMKKADS